MQSMDATMDGRNATWKKGRKLADLKQGDIIYIQKTINGFSHTYECEFLGYVKGNVQARILKYSPQWAKPESDRITAKPTSCYLWGGRRPFNGKSE